MLEYNLFIKIEKLKVGNFGYNYDYVINSSGATSSCKRYVMKYLNLVTEADTAMITTFKNFQNTFTNTDKAKLKSGNWCSDDKSYSNNKRVTLLSEVEKQNKYYSEYLIR